MATSRIEGKYGTSKAEAVIAYNDDLPSLLPNSNKWKPFVEEHRWGYHGDAAEPGCPICDRDKGGDPA